MNFLTRLALRALEQIETAQPLPQPFGRDDAREIEEFVDGMVAAAATPAGDAPRHLPAARSAAGQSGRRTQALSPPPPPPPPPRQRIIEPTPRTANTPRRNGLAESRGVPIARGETPSEQPARSAVAGIATGEAPRATTKPPDGPPQPPGDEHAVPRERRHSPQPETNVERPADPRLAGEPQPVRTNDRSLADDGSVPAVPAVADGNAGARRQAGVAHEHFQAPAPDHKSEKESFAAAAEIRAHVAGHRDEREAPAPDSPAPAARSRHAGNAARAAPAAPAERSPEQGPPWEDKPSPSIAAHEPEGAPRSAWRGPADAARQATAESPAVHALPDRAVRFVEQHPAAQTDGFAKEEPAGASLHDPGFAAAAPRFEPSAQSTQASPQAIPPARAPLDRRQPNAAPAPAKAINGDARANARRDDGAPQSEAIEVHIDHIEVHAPPPAPPKRPTRPQRRARVSLEDYLARRRGDRR